MKSILTVLFAFVTFGCGESAFEPANLDAEGKTAAGPVEDRERKERAAAEVQASLDRLSETSAEIDRVLRSSTLDSLGLNQACSELKKAE